MKTKELINAVKNERGSAFQNCNDCEYGTHNGEVIEKLNRLAELEDKIEQGTLIELPCKVGDTVWLIVEKRWSVGKKQTFLYVQKSKLTYFNMERVINDIGKTVFLTREEAEQRLKEIQG